MDMIRGGDDVKEVVAEREKRDILAQRVKEFKKGLNEKEVFIFEQRIMAEEPLPSRRSASSSRSPVKEPGR